MGHRFGAGVFRLGLILVSLNSCKKQSPPDLPAIDTQNFLPSIRAGVETAIRDARSSPGDPEQNGKLGMLLHAHDRLDSALICYRRAHFLNPLDYRWSYYLGVVYSSMSKHSEALAAFRHSLAQKQDHLAARARLAEALLESGQFAQARSVYEAIITARPDHAASYYGAGKASTAAGNLPRAAEYYQMACERYPRYAAARYALGLASRQLGRAEEARRHLALYERDKSGAPPLEDPLLAAVRAHSGGVLPLLAKAKALASSGKWSEAIELHLQALQLDPKQEQTHINLISLYGRMGDYPSAEKHYQMSLALNPNRDESHYNFAVLLSSQGRLPEAVPFYRKALAINPLHPEANNNLAYLLAARNEFEAALRHTETALENRPNYPQAHFNAGSIQLRRKRYQDAIRHYEAAALSNDDNLARYLHALASAHAQAGNRELAIPYARRAREAAASRRQKSLVALIESEFPGLTGAGRTQ